MKALAAGQDHACALHDDGTVSCWGDLGGGTSTMTPLVAPGVAGATAIAASDLDTCAVVADGGVICWGFSFHSGPTRVAGLDGSATSIAMTNDVTCAVLADHEVQCWGDDTNGLLGDGVTPGSVARVVTTPVTVVTSDADGGA